MPEREATMTGGFLTMTQAKEYLRVDRAVLIRAIRAGELAAVQIGARGDYRIRASDLDEWIIRQRTGPAA